MKQKGKGTHGHGQQCGDCGGAEGWVQVEEGIKGINGDGKKYNNDNLKNRITEGLSETGEGSQPAQL